MAGKSVDLLSPDGSKKGSRVWIDGCFDLIMCCHANTLQQAKQYGKKLIVGVYNDDDIEDNKGEGLPIFSEEERYKLISAFKWVDEVVEDAPYITTVSTLNQLDCDFCLIPDFPENIDENHSEIRLTNRYKNIEITGRVSENEIIGRMTLLDKSHHLKLSNIEKYSDLIQKFSLDSTGQHSSMTISVYDQSSKSCVNLTEGPNPKLTDKIVYVAGGFDVFHAGHLTFFEAAKEIGNYLTVGVYTDQDVNEEKGLNYPLTNLLERVLTISSLKCVSRIIIGAPKTVDASFINRFNIQFIASAERGDTVIQHRYGVAKKLGIFVEIILEFDIATSEIMEKIIQRRLDRQNSVGDISSYNSSPANNNQH